MGRELIVSINADEYLKRMQPKHEKQVMEKIYKLLEYPFPNGYVHVKGQFKRYRIRSGVYRVIYRVTEEQIYIELVGHRKDIYQD